MKYKLIIYATLIATMLFLLLSSCNINTQQQGQNDNGDNEIKFEVIKAERSYLLENKDDYPSCNLYIDIMFPVESNKYDLAKIQDIFLNSLIGTSFTGMEISDALEKYISDYISNYKRDAEIYKTTKPSKGEYSSEFEDLYHEDGEHSNLPEIFYSYYESITDSIVYNHHGVLSLQVRQTNNKGGNISYEIVRNYVVDLESGELMSEGDFFSAGYDVSLQPIIQNSLMHVNGVKSISDLEDLGYFGIDEIIPNNNFLITEDGIVYTFNKGEYSAYQLPVSEILIPYSHVRSILKESSIANKLLQQ